MLKPEITGVSLDTEFSDKFNKAFKYKAFPVSLDLGTMFNIFGVEVGDVVGVSVFPILSTLQLDTLNQNYSKIAYGNFYLKKDYWQITYASVLDPGATGAAYYAATERKDWMNFVKFINTLSMTVRF